MMRHRNSNIDNSIKYNEVTRGPGSEHELFCIIVIIATRKIFCTCREGQVKHREGLWVSIGVSVVIRHKFQLLITPKML